MEFLEFQVGAWQVNDHEAQIILFGSPVGGLRRPITVTSNATQLHADFETVIADLYAKKQDATQRIRELGKQLAQIILPPAISSLLTRSMDRISPEGIRIRLCLDESLVDLPWEYIFAPEIDATFGFLILNPRVSIVREAPLISQEQTASMQKQRLVFAGAFQHDGYDHWNVESEFQELKRALEKVSNLLAIDFIRSSNDNIQQALTKETEIFHYSGHVDKTNGRGYLIKELHGDYGASDRLYSDTLAVMLRKAGTRLAMFSACNSGRWFFVKPLVDAGIPIIIGAFGTITTNAAIAFCDKLYSALAVGLSLDEAVTWARLHVRELEQSQNEFYEWGSFMVYMSAKETVIFPRPDTSDLSKLQNTAMESRKQTIANVIGYFSSEVKEITKNYFEPLIGVGTDEEIQNQDLDSLEDALSRLNDVMNHPESYGTVKIKISADKRPIITFTDSESHFEIGIMPTLLEKKKLITERIRLLKGTVNHEKPPKGAGHMDYCDLSINVQDDGDIRATSEQGEWHGKLNLDQIREIGLAMQLIEEDRTNEDLLKKVGTTLYNALFDKKISANFAATKASAEQKEGCGVRLRLIFEKPEMAAIPWEFLYDESTNTFLANDPATALSRYIDVPLKKQDIKPASLPLKMLLVIPSPKNLPPLDSTGEVELIKEALQDHIKSGQIEIDVLTEATVIEINKKLDEKSYNVLHFIGHGVFENGKGYIALIDENSHSKLLDDQHFANLFLGKRGLGLVILNSCEGAAKSSSQVFAGMAPRLVQKGIPAVVAMQYSIRDSTAKLFADKFYRSLALAKPVDETVQSTRNLISIQVGLDKRDFATPVLYMRAKDGIILDLPKKKMI